MLFETVVATGSSGVVVLAVIGDLDIASAPKFQRELHSSIDAAGPAGVVLDLAGVDLVDGIGLGVVLDGIKRTGLRGGRLVIARPGPQARRELELTRLVEILPVHETIEDAMAAVEGEVLGS
jgi:anti-sigma B factor antagonist